MDFFKRQPEISTVKDDMFDPVWAQEFHSCIYHELLYVIKGEINLTYQDGSCAQANPGDILINPAENLHQDVFDLDKELTVLIIHFSWDGSEDYFSKVNNDSLNNIKPATIAEIKKILDAMRYDKGPHEIDKIVANTRLTTILSLIYRDIAYPDEPETMDIMEKQKQLVIEAKKYMNRFFRDPIGLTDIADYLHVSPFYMSRIFSRENGFSLISYLTDRRIDEAKKMLKDKRFIIADIAEMVGYSNRNYFSKVFKSRTGCSPKEYC